MARFAANAAGEIIQFARTYSEEKSFNIPPSAVFTLQFDEQSNAGIIAAYDANPATFAMAGGTLTQSGVEATINPPLAFYRAFLNVAALKAKRDNTNDPYTREEVSQILAAAFRGAGLE